MTLAIVLVAHTYVASLHSELYKPQVRVLEQKADVEPGSAPPRLRATVTFENRLSVPVTGVHLGLLIAEKQEDFAGVTPATIYEKGPTPGQAVRALEQEIAVSLPPNGMVTASLPIALSNEGPRPGVLLSHVLSYTLGDINADTLLFLLNSSASADQVAACSALGLGADPNGRNSARLHWSGKPHLREDLEAVLLAPPPPAPNQADTFSRVYAALALGVLGGHDSQQTLRRVASDPNLSDYDPPMQVLKRARQEGSPRQTPLAFAIPEGTESFSQVVQEALNESGSSNAAAIAQRPHVMVAMGMIAAMVATALAVRRSRRQPSVN